VGEACAVYTPAQLSLNYKELEESYMVCKLTSGQNLHEFFDDLEHHNKRLGQVNEKYLQDEETLKVHIMGRLPKEYASLQTKYHDRLDEVELEYLKRDIFGEYKLLMKSQKVEKVSMTTKKKEKSPRLFAEGMAKRVTRLQSAGEQTDH
jgi:hypothetical protein